jgi:hypothetical protein
MRRLRALLLTAREINAWLRERRLRWLAPLVLLLLFLGGILSVAASAPALSPFLYALF